MNADQKETVIQAIADASDLCALLRSADTLLGFVAGHSGLAFKPGRARAAYEKRLARARAAMDELTAAAAALDDTLAAVAV